VPSSEDLQSPASIRQWLVRLGQLDFDDFLLLSAETLDVGHWTPDLVTDWSLATNNAPHVEVHFRNSANLQPATCNLQSPLALADITAAQSRLVHAFAYALLRAKAPPLYDALPWHDWDFSIVTRRFRLFRTRLLLAGDGTSVVTCRCRKTAGVYVLEPDAATAGYIGAKCDKARVRRLQVIRAPLSRIPLADGSVDLAVVGSVPSLSCYSERAPVPFASRPSGSGLPSAPLPPCPCGSGFPSATPPPCPGGEDSPPRVEESLSRDPSSVPEDWQSVTRELLRVARHVLLVENNPLCPALDPSLPALRGLVSETVQVRGLGSRPCHWGPAAR